MISEPVSGGDGRFAGGAFDPQLANGRASGDVILAYDAIRFESDKGAVQLPLDGIQIALGGANDRLIFFTHPGRPETTIHTADHTVLNHSILAQRRDLLRQIAQVRRKKRTALVVILSVLTLLVGAVVALVLSKDLLVEAAANGIPVQWEITLGEKLFSQISRSSRFVSDPGLESQFKELTSMLVDGIGPTRYPLKFHMVEDPTLNAFAMPGGHVVVHTGLLLAADTPEEVAGVLAHEIAHVTRRHGFRSVISSAGLYIILQFFVGDASSLLAVIADNGAFLLDRKFSRDFEREADEVGWNYLLQADIEPRGMIEFFKKMRVEERKQLEQIPIEGGETALSFVSTHPPTEERMKALQARWERLKKQSGYKKIPLSYGDFKDSLRARLHSAPNPQKD